jgi:hypothetical protein
MFPCNRPAQDSQLRLDLDTELLPKYSSSVVADVCWPATVRNRIVTMIEKDSGDLTTVVWEGAEGLLQNVLCDL